MNLIEAHLDTWYGGDYDTAESLRHPQTLGTGPSEETARGEVQYQALLGAEVELLGCEPLSPSILRCQVSYSNVLNEAVGEPPAVVWQQFGVEEGHIVLAAGPYLEDEQLTTSFRRFAELKLANLEDWASWHLIEHD